MASEVIRDAEQPTIQNESMRYEGLRFRAECRLAGRLYGQPFGVDVVFGDPLVGEPEILLKCRAAPDPKREFGHGPVLMDGADSTAETIGHESSVPSHRRPLLRGHDLPRWAPAS